MELDTQSLLALDAARTPGELHQACKSGTYNDDNDERHLYVGSCYLGTINSRWFSVAQCEDYARAIVAAVNALGPLCRRVQLLENELQAHRRYHAKVGCPSGDDCYVCALEAQLLDHGIKPTGT